MIDKSRFKQLLGLALLAVLATGALAALGLAGRVVARFASGAVPADALHEVRALPAEEAVTWAPDANDGRPMEPATREEIRSGYVRAWAELDIAATTGRGEGLRTYFAGPALKAVLAGAGSTGAGSTGAGSTGTGSTGTEATEFPGLGVAQLDHHLTLRFYSDDGSIVGFRDEPAGLVRSDGDTVLDGREAYDVVMLLEDGNWRVRHWVRTSAEVRTTIDAPPAPTGTSPAALAGLNYYPRREPFERFWPAYDPAVVDADLARIGALGLNSIRVFLDYYALGGSRPDPAVLSRVRDLLDRAQGHGLGVVATLFDRRTDHRPAAWGDDDRHLAGVVPALAGHPALWLWDLKNEPDLDDDRPATRAEVRAWLAHVARQVRALDPVTPHTIGWSTAAEAIDSAPVVDVVSFHHYAPAADLAEALPAVLQAASGRPVVLSEFGLPTWNSLWPGGHTEAEQARYYADVLSEVRQANLAGYLAWTLHDLAAPPPGVIPPWRRGTETHLGVLRASGEEKPAAALLRPGADLAGVPRLGPAARLAKPFWRLVIVVLAGVALAGGALLWRRRRPGRA